MTRKPRPPEWRPRRCKYCKLLFVPVMSEKNKNPNNAKNQKFCCKQHRTAYANNGGMNMERFKEVTERFVRKIVADEIGKLTENFRSDVIEALKPKVRELLNGSRGNQDVPAEPGFQPAEHP